MQPTAELPVLERDAEIGTLERLLGDLSKGAGRLVLAEGPAGIGKTTLLRYGKRLADKRGVVALSARGTELEREFSFGLVRQLFESHLRALDQDARERGFGGPAALTRSLLGHGEEPEQPPGRDPGFPLLHGLYWLMANLAEEHPLLLVLDDMQWADTQSVRFVEFLAARLNELSIGVVIARRTGEPEDEAVAQTLDRLGSDPHQETLRPADLSRGAVTDLIETALGTAPSSRFVDAIQEATGGNPFLLRELLRELGATRIDPTDAAAAGVAAMAPDTVSRSVLVRLARLSSRALAVARALAVLGDGTEPATVAALARLDERETREAVDDLARAEVIRPDRPLAFVHPLVRNAIYNEIESSRLEEMHRAAATTLRSLGAGSERIASHLLRTDPALDATVVETLRDAARLASARGAAAAAAKYLRRAVLEPPPPAMRLEIEREVVSAAIAAGEAAGAPPDLFDGAIARLEADPHELALAAPDLAIGLMTLGRVADGSKLLLRAVDAVSPVDPELALRLEAELMTLAQWHEETWRDVLERMREIKHDPPKGETLGQQLVLANLAHLFGLTGEIDASRCADFAERALRDGTIITAHGADRIQVVQAIRGLVRSERLASAVSWAERARDEARRRGLPVGFALNSVYKAQAEFLQGGVASAEADARAAFDVARSGGWATVAATVPATLMDVLLERGQVAEAQRTLDDSGLAHDIAPAGHAVTYILHSRGRMRLAQGLTAQGLEDLFALGEACERLYGQRDIPGWQWAAPAAPVLAQLGREDEALALLSEELEAAKGWNAPGWIAVSLRALGSITSGDKGIGLLEESVELARASESKLELSRSLVALGAALRRGGRRAHARVPLKEALELARRGGATATAARARDELEATGERVSREIEIGVDALTPSERRIATLAAEGMTNPQIAQSLFVTVKTVEAHLRNAYRKLDISSRKELPAALTDD